MGDAPDYPRLAAEVLGIRNAPPELARRLVAQALVIEDRRDAWRRSGERICARRRRRRRASTCCATRTGGAALRRQGDQPAAAAAHALCARRWRGLKAPLARAADAEWQEVGSELEALLREARLIRELQPLVNVQVGPPALGARRCRPRSSATSSSSLPVGRGGFRGARRGARRRRLADPADAAERRRSRRPCAARLFEFFSSPLRTRDRRSQPLAPIVFSWLAGRGATRDAARSARCADGRSALQRASDGAARGRASVYRANRCAIRLGDSFRPSRTRP